MHETWCTQNETNTFIDFHEALPPATVGYTNIAVVLIKMRKTFVFFFCTFLFLLSISFHSFPSRYRAQPHDVQIFSSSTECILYVVCKKMYHCARARTRIYADFQLKICSEIRVEEVIESCLAE